VRDVEQSRCKPLRKGKQANKYGLRRKSNPLDSRKET